MRININAKPDEKIDEIVFSDDLENETLFIKINHDSNSDVYFRPITLIDDEEGQEIQLSKSQVENVIKGLKRALEILAE